MYLLRGWTRSLHCTTPVVALRIHFPHIDTLHNDWSPTNPGVTLRRMQGKKNSPWTRDQSQNVLRTVRNMLSIVIDAIIDTLCSKIFTTQCIAIIQGVKQNVNTLKNEVHLLKLSHTQIYVCVRAEYNIPPMARRVYTTFYWRLTSIKSWQYPLLSSRGRSRRML